MLNQISVIAVFISASYFSCEIVIYTSFLYVKLHLNEHVNSKNNKIFFKKIWQFNIVLLAYC